jgi:hypothetical protein
MAAAANSSPGPSRCNHSSFNMKENLSAGLPVVEKIIRRHAFQP